MPVERRPIPSFPGYEADSDGCIWSTTNWRGYGDRKLTQQPDRHGYFRVRLVDPDRLKEVRKQVHRLVCEAFHGPPAEGQQVRHLDGTRTNNVPSNLRWGTVGENAADRRTHGTVIEGEAHHNRRKTHCAQGHEFTPENTALKKGKRCCRTCIAASAAARYERTKAKR